MARKEHQAHKMMLSRAQVINSEAGPGHNIRSGDIDVDSLEPLQIDNSEAGGDPYNSTGQFACPKRRR